MISLARSWVHEVRRLRSRGYALDSFALAALGVVAVAATAGLVGAVVWVVVVYPAVLVGWLALVAALLAVWRLVLATEARDPDAEVTVAVQVNGHLFSVSGSRAAVDAMIEERGWDRVAD